MFKRNPSHAVKCEIKNGEKVYFLVDQKGQQVTPDCPTFSLAWAELHGGTGGLSTKTKARAIRASPPSPLVAPKTKARATAAFRFAEGSGASSPRGLELARFKADRHSTGFVSDADDRKTGDTFTYTLEREDGTIWKLILLKEEVQASFGNWHEMTAVLLSPSGSVARTGQRGWHKPLHFTETKLSLLPQPQAEQWMKWVLGIRPQGVIPTDTELRQQLENVLWLADFLKNQKGPVVLTVGVDNAIGLAKGQRVYQRDY